MSKPRQVVCPFPFCGRILKLRKDGRLPVHRARVLVATAGIQSRPYCLLSEARYGK